MNTSIPDNIARKKDLLFDIEHFICSKGNVRLQRMINDVAVQVFGRIIQLTHSQPSWTHQFVRCLGWYNESLAREILPHVISKSSITRNLQRIMDDITYSLNIGDDVFYRAINKDVIRMEDFIISSICAPFPLEKTISTELILSRFLWIAYARITHMAPDDMKTKTRVISYSDFCKMISLHAADAHSEHEWVHYVQEAATLAKNRVRLQYAGQASSEQDTPELRTQNKPDESDIISVSEIKASLQKALDTLFYKDNGNQRNQYVILSRDVHWFCDIFLTRGKVLIELPRMNTPIRMFLSFLESKFIDPEPAPPPKLVESELDGKDIICYERTIQISPNSDLPIFVCKGTISCHRHGHPIANVEGLVQSMTGGRVSVPIQRCLTCNPTRLFILNTILIQYESQYGPLYCRKVDDSDATELSLWHSHNTESLLHSYGYNVNEYTGLSSHQRQKILADIIASHRISKSDIMKHIDLLIRMHHRDPRYDVAVAKWTDDLRFLAAWADSTEAWNGYFYR